MRVSYCYNPKKPPVHAHWGLFIDVMKRKQRKMETSLKNEDEEFYVAIIS
jgi:hypothetical protein